MKEQTICNRCGKKMVLKPPTIIFLTSPPQYDEVFWCNCGNTVNNGRVWRVTLEQQLKEDWEKLNEPTSNT